MLAASLVAYQLYDIMERTHSKVNNYNGLSIRHRSLYRKQAEKYDNIAIGIMDQAYSFTFTGKLCSSLTHDLLTQKHELFSNKDCLEISNECKRSNCTKFLGTDACDDVMARKWTTGNQSPQIKSVLNIISQLSFAFYFTYGVVDRIVYG